MSFLTVFKYLLLYNGDIMFKIGDVVTRNSYGNDIIFEIIDMNGNNCVLKGIDVRLYADSNVEDLKLFLDKRDDNFFPLIDTVDKEVIVC